MKKANKSLMTKFESAHYRSNNRRLEDCYTTYSTAKDEAYEYCRDKFRLFNGVDFKIISYNTMTFSVGFYGVHPDTEEEVFVVITRDYDRYIPLDELD